MKLQVYLPHAGMKCMSIVHMQPHRGILAQPKDEVQNNMEIFPSIGTF